MLHFYFSLVLVTFTLTVCGSTTDYMAYIKVNSIGMAPLKHSSPEQKDQGMLLLNCGQTKLSAVSLSGHNWACTLNRDLVQAIDLV